MLGRIFIRPVFCIRNVMDDPVSIFPIRLLLPLYVAWFILMFRFNIMPWLLGYSMIGMLSFPMEGEISSALYDIFKNK